MHILTDMTVYGLDHEPRLQGIIPKDFFSAWGLIRYDTAFADKVIRRCKKSLYEDYLAIWEDDSSDYNWSFTENFYSIAMAFRERCEDKGRCTLAGKITTESIDDFIQQNNSTFKNKA